MIWGPLIGAALTVLSALPHHQPVRGQRVAVVASRRPEDLAKARWFTLCSRCGWVSSDSLRGFCPGRSERLRREGARRRRER